MTATHAGPGTATGPATPDADAADVAPAGPPDLPPGALLAPRVGTLWVRRGPEHLQIGLGPGRAVEVRCPPGCPPDRLGAVLDTLDGRTTVATVLDATGVPAGARDEVRGILRDLVTFGHLRHCPAPVRDTGTGLPPVRAVHLLGTGPLAQLLRTPLRVNSCRVTTAANPGLAFDPVRPPWDRDGIRPDLVILTDAVVPEPATVAALVESGIPHLHVHCRDGGVVVGPTVLPGTTACLRCTDLYRAERDPYWPQVAAQLLGLENTAPGPALTSAIALVLSEIQLSRGAAGTPQTLGASVEIDPAEGRWIRRAWPAHPACSCGAAAAARAGAALP